MIDTIRFVLHSVNEKTYDLHPGSLNAKKYASDFNRLLYERLLEYESKYIVREKHVLNQNVLVNPDDTYFQSEVLQRQGFVHREAVFKQRHDRGEFYFKSVRGQINTPSSDYNINFSVSENSDAITFECSIPKYFFNHNIAQFVPQIGSRRFKSAPWHMYTFAGQVKEIRTRIYEFIYTFFDDLSYMLNLPSVQAFDIANIEIRRLDLCYNQLFPNNAYVLDFLHAQKKFKNTKIRANAIVDDDFDTSFGYRHSTDGFYFKIYSKGHEFLRNDFPRIMKENKAYIEDNKQRLYPILANVFKEHFPKQFADAQSKGNKVYDVMFEYYHLHIQSGERPQFCDAFEKHLKHKPHFLLKEAMRILRYEMSFTTKYMSTLYKREIYRKHCSHWKKLMRSHNLVKRHDLLLSQGKTIEAKEFQRKYLLGRQQRIEHDAIDRSLHKKHDFRLSTSNAVKAHEKAFTETSSLLTVKNYKIGESDIATLSDDLLKTLYKKFEDEIEFYQVKEVKEVTTILEAIEDYNEKVEERIENYKRMHGAESFKKLKHTFKRKHGLSQLNKKRLKLVIDRIDKGEALKNICDDMGMSKSAYHVLVQDLKIFDLHKTSVRRKFNYSFLRSDWKPYYDQFQIDRDYHRKLFHVPSMIEFDTTRLPY